MSDFFRLIETYSTNPESSKALVNIMNSERAQCIMNCYAYIQQAPNIKPALIVLHRSLTPTPVINLSVLTRIWLQLGNNQNLIKELLLNNLNNPDDTIADCSASSISLILRIEMQNSTQVFKQIIDILNNLISTGQPNLIVGALRIAYYFLSFSHKNLSILEEYLFDFTLKMMCSDVPTPVRILASKSFALICRILRNNRVVKTESIQSVLTLLQQPDLDPAFRSSFYYSFGFFFRKASSELSNFSQGILSVLLGEIQNSKNQQIIQSIVIFCRKIKCYPFYVQDNIGQLYSAFLGLLTTPLRDEAFQTIKYILLCLQDNLDQESFDLSYSVIAQFSTVAIQYISTNIESADDDEKIAALYTARLITKITRITDNPIIPFLSTFITQVAHLAQNQAITEQAILVISKTIRTFPELANSDTAIQFTTSFVEACANNTPLLARASCFFVFNFYKTVSQDSELMSTRVKLFPRFLSILWSLFGKPFFLNLDFNIKNHAISALYKMFSNVANSGQIVEVKMSFMNSVITELSKAIPVNEELSAALISVLYCLAFFPESSEFAILPACGMLAQNGLVAFQNSLSRWPESHSVQVAVSKVFGSVYYFGREHIPPSLPQTIPILLASLKSNNFELVQSAIHSINILFNKIPQCVQDFSQQIIQCLMGIIFNQDGMMKYTPIITLCDILTHIPPNLGIQIRDNLLHLIISINQEQYDLETKAGQSQSRIPYEALLALIGAIVYVSEEDPNWLKQRPQKNEIFSFLDKKEMLEIDQNRYLKLIALLIKTVVRAPQATHRANIQLNKPLVKNALEIMPKTLLDKIEMNKFKAL